ncbi:MAG: hypothetical protein IKU29_05060 [Parabacteroides sp.]|nr:hypothetical protein [Parabacteroides sp.]
MLYAVTFIVGVIVGFVVTRIIFKPKYSGALRLYQPDPNEPATMYLELEEPADNIRKYKSVIFDVRF